MVNRGWIPPEKFDAELDNKIRPRKIIEFDAVVRKPETVYIILFNVYIFINIAKFFHAKKCPIREQVVLQELRTNGQIMWSVAFSFGRSLQYV